MDDLPRPSKLGKKDRIEWYSPVDLVSMEWVDGIESIVESCSWFARGG